MEETVVRPDSKGSANLGDLAQGVSRYRVRKQALNIWLQSSKTQHDFIQEQLSAGGILFLLN